MISRQRLAHKKRRAKRISRTGMSLSWLRFWRREMMEWGNKNHPSKRAREKRQWIGEVVA